ncbi:MAG TPA: LysM peptidoglycan-binding domain-containing protein [Anaerolineales bacterium]|nr:LysM peptidoglycan-binding domain-containing protein [Anaerolineales bacterium]
MAVTIRGVRIASILMLVAIVASACNQPYSQAPVVTNTPIDPNSLFATPFGGATEMSPVEIFSSQTAQAANTGAPVIATATGGVAVTPQAGTTTSTPFVSLPSNPTVTLTSTLALPPGGITSTPAPSGPRPPTYTLQRDEFPFCIARRLNVDPSDLLQASNLSSPDIYYAGLVLTIPQNSVWPVEDLGQRALRTHPAPYSVSGNADTTVHGVACKFGDVTPESIVGANSGLSLGSTLTVGQSLNIP